MGKWLPHLARHMRFVTHLKVGTIEEENVLKKVTFVGDRKYNDAMAAPVV